MSGGTRLPVDPVLQDIDNRTANLMNKLANGQSVKDDLSGFLNKVSCLRYAPIMYIVYASSVTCFRLLFSTYKWEDPCYGYGIGIAKLYGEQC